MSATEEDSTPEGTVKLYRIPLERVNGVAKPSYSPSVNGKLYLYHYGTEYLYVIQEVGAGHFHRETVNVDVEELPKEGVEASDNLIRDYT